jgi:hypothetical protein
MRARAHRRGGKRGVLTAALALVALALQLLSPVVCQAQPRAEPVTMVVCTSHGLATITLEDQQKAPPSRCEHCTAAHVVAEPTGSAQVAVVLYVSAITAAPDVRDSGPAFARAPPRPPSQAPPILTQT